jgi:hypothetical protein
MQVKLNYMGIGLALLSLAAAGGELYAAPPNTPGATRMVITLQPEHKGGQVPASLQPGEVIVTEGKTNLPVTGFERLAGSFANMQLFVLLDDSTRSASLGTHLPELQAFLTSLPPETQVAVGYMHNGTFALAQAFTTDHARAAASLRLPLAVPGENGSPYFVLSDLARHWPSKEPTRRRAVLALTDGVDRYYDSSIEDDPYVNQAIHDSLANGVMIYSIYLRGAGFYGRGAWTANMAQSRLLQVTAETGGYAYFQAFTDPVAIEPFLGDFKQRLDHQYELTLQPLSARGVQAVKLRTELPGVKVEGPSRIYVR